MKTTKFTEEQIAFARRQADTDTKVDEVRENWPPPPSSFLKSPRFARAQNRIQLKFDVVDK